MIKIFTIHLICILASLIATAQDTGELARRRGFKDIRLGTHIDSIRGTTFKKEGREKNEFPVEVYEVDHPDYKKIGDIEIEKVELSTYKQMVYQIVVIADKDPRLMKGMIKSFGQPKYIVTTDTYNWLTDSLSLTFKKHSKKEVQLTYRYYPLLKMMRTDKGKEIDEIATDF